MAMAINIILSMKNNDILFWASDENSAALSAFDENIVFASFNLHKLVDEPIRKQIATNIYFYLNPEDKAFFSGHVADLENNPLEGARIEINEKIISTDNEGNFSVPIIPNQACQVKISKEGYFPYEILEEVNLALGETLNRSFTFDPVRNCTVSGKISLASEKDLEDFSVKILNSDNQCFTNENGEYNLENILPGEKVLKLSKSGYLQQYMPLSFANGETKNRY